MERTLDAMRKFSRDMSDWEAERGACRGDPPQPDRPEGPLIPLRLLVPMLLAWTLAGAGILYAWP